MDVGSIDAGNGGDLALHVAFDLIAHGTGGDGEGDADRGDTVVECDVAHHAELDDVGAQFRVDDAAQGLLDMFDRGRRGHAGKVGATGAVPEQLFH